MIAKYKFKWNFFTIAGIFMLLFGGVLGISLENVSANKVVFLGVVMVALALGLVGCCFVVIGCTYLVMGKGYGAGLGVFLGLCSPLGLFIACLLPDRHERVQVAEREKAAEAFRKCPPRPCPECEKPVRGTGPCPWCGASLSTTSESSDTPCVKDSAHHGA